MAFTLDAAITAARDRHSAFHRTRIPNGVLARCLTDVQNELIVKATASERTYLAQTCTIALDLDAASQVGVAGAGTAGGLPGTVTDAGYVQASQSSAGSLITLGLTALEGAAVLVSERVVTSATSTTTTSTGAARTVNADIGYLVVITAGLGAEQVREITANTADTWTHAAWTTIPDATSMVSVVAPSYDTTEAAGVITAIPALAHRNAFLVTLNASGIPVIDYTAPIVVDVEAGVPLPSMQTLLGGTIRWADGTTEELSITSYARRADPTDHLAVYPVAEAVRFVGTQDDWADVESLELLYAPIAPTFTALTDLFLLPDAGKAAVVAHAAAFMAMRVEGTEAVSIDAAAYLARAIDAERTYLSSVRQMTRARTTRMRGQD